MSPLILPQENGLDVAPINGLFRDVSSSYKFYWFLSILDEVEAGNTSIPMERLTERMLQWAWYPVMVCRLSMGPNESIPQLLQELQTQYREDSPSFSQIHDIAAASPNFRQRMKVLSRMVPYRFLSAWGLGARDTTVKAKSQNFTQNCLYAIRSVGVIDINPNWIPYLKKHLGILRDFTYWHLCQYLQKRNPNVPNIAGKIIPLAKRASLKKQTEFWNEILESHPMHCIYSGAMLGPGDYELDHFVPWSFVSHDQLWNLIPAAATVNAAKSDRLPDLDFYLPRYAAFQLDALRFYIHHHEAKKPSELLEDYCAVHLTVEEICEIPEEKFESQLRSSFSPMIEIASNLGFESHWRYS